MFFLYLHAQTSIKTFIHLTHSKWEKKTELNELEYLKTLSNMCSNAHWHAFLYLLRNVSKYSFILFKIRKKKTELNELSGLEYLKIPSQISSYAQKHVFLYLHA